MKHRTLALGALSVMCALSCGEVPTLDQGIAYISPIILPSPAVAVGDQLRDSVGNVVPLRIEAFGRNDERLPDPAATFLTTVLPSPITIGADGIVTASDTVSAVRALRITCTSVARAAPCLRPTALANCSPSWKRCWSLESSLTPLRRSGTVATSQATSVRSSARMEPEKSSG